MNGLMQQVLEEKQRQVQTIESSATVAEAVAQMNEHKIGALVVVSSDIPVGMFTERDLLTRVVASELDVQGTVVGEVMTRHVNTVSATTSVKSAMTIMTERRCRHLPVVEGAEVLGIVSMGDLTRWIAKDRKLSIDELQRYIGSG